MELFESHRKKFFRNMLVVFPLLFLLVIASVFFAGVSFTSKDTLQKEQQLLEQSLKRGAVHTYALTGRYPESAEELIKDYHITYDSSRFVIEYVPNGSNLFPMISGIPLSVSFSNRKEAAS